MGLMSEYIKQRMSAKDLEDELLKLIGEYNKIRGTYLIVYAGAISKAKVPIALGMDDYYIIYDMLRDVKFETLDFYVETPGGSGETAEEIVRFIRGKFKVVNFIVSGEAKSAGTILVLSGDEILMTGSGSLGPIDAQIRIGRSTVSAHDYVEWVNEKQKEAEENGMLNPFDATVVAQVSPGEFKHVFHALKFAEDLVKDWLPKYKFKNWMITETRKLDVTDEMRTNRADEIAKELTNHGKWRSHGRSLKIPDLDGIGLKVINVDEDTALAEVVYRIQTVIRLLFHSTTIYKIFATQDEKIFEQAMSIDTQPIPKKNADVIELELDCKKCGKLYKLFGKFTPDPKIDSKYEKKGFMPFPKDNKLKCDCNFEMDLSGIRNEIEIRAGKKLIIPK